jgi:hypothetical protein
MNSLLSELFVPSYMFSHGMNTGLLFSEVHSEIHNEKNMLISGDPRKDI